MVMLFNLHMETIYYNLLFNMKQLIKQKLIRRENNLLFNMKQLIKQKLIRRENNLLI
jgi:hypothetical protein